MTDQQIKFMHALELAAKGYGRDRIAKETGLPVNIARAATYAAGLLPSGQDNEQSEFSQVVVDAAFNGFDDGIDEFARPVDITDSKRILTMSDIHVPYHHLDAVLAAIRSGLKHGVDTVYLNGDIMDCYAVSSFSKNPTMPGLVEELNKTRELFERLRQVFPKARILYKLGNHEARLERYIHEKAPQLIGVEALKLGELLNCTNLGIQIVEDNQIAKAGRLFIAHGHEYKTFFAGGIYHARNTRLKSGNKNILFGHFHRKQEDSARDLEGKTTGAWATGCLCKLNPRYAGMTQWTHGFAIVEMNGQEFHVDNVEIF